MRDFRFHVASLIAVFLALGVGIFTGYALVISQQMDPLRAQITQVTRENASAEQENKSLQEQVDALSGERQRVRSENDRLADLSIVGRLSGRTVSLISVGAPPGRAVTESIWDALIPAGARRVNELVIHGPLQPSSPAAAEQILDQLHADPNTPPEIALAEAIGHTVGAGQNPLLPAALSHRGAAIDPAGTFGVPPSLVVLLSNVDTADRLSALERGDTPETTLIRTLQALNIRVVEVEPSFLPFSGASYFRRLGVTSVDDVDTMPGRVALVWACLGYSGHFGVKPGADSVLPVIVS